MKVCTNVCLAYEHCTTIFFQTYFIIIVIVFVSKDINRVFRNKIVWQFAVHTSACDLVVIVITRRNTNLKLVNKIITGSIIMLIVVTIL